MITFIAPTAGSKRKANDSGDNHHESKRQRTVTTTPVAMADGNLPLKKTWELMGLKDNLGLLTKFRVRRLPCYPMSMLTLKGPHPTCYGQETGVVGELGRSSTEVQRQGEKDGELELMCI